MPYVVIFKAQIHQLDDHYLQTAQRLRERALTEFHCLQFEALSDAQQEMHCPIGGH